MSTFMMVFFSKAFNIAPLVPIVKSPLNEKTVNPFLCLVDDSKLQAANTASTHHIKTYGSKEDAAAISFSSRAKRLPVKKILGLADSEQLRRSTRFGAIYHHRPSDDFLPDDTCVTGLQFKETPAQTQNSKKDYVAQVEVMPPLISFDDDVSAKVFERAADPNQIFLQILPFF